jgi:hypothetical protein
MLPRSGASPLREALVLTGNCGRDASPDLVTGTGSELC